MQVGGMDALLSRMLEGLERLHRRVLLAALRPGVPAVHTRSVLEASALPSNPQVEALYRWRDGTDMGGGVLSGDVWLFPGYFFLSIEDAVLEYRLRVDDPRWSPGWFPVFANGGGDFYVVDFTLGADGPIRHFEVYAHEQPVEFLSLESMLRTVVAGFEREVFFVNRRGYLEMDYREFESLCAKLNPEVAWWAD